MDRNNSNNSGCGCLGIIIIISVLFIYQKCNETKTTGKNTNNCKTEQDESYNNTSEYIYEERLSAEDSLYLNNSLATGATPYKQYYGNNYYCSSSQCSGIEVTAPVSSDIIVIIKKGNQNGEVVSHSYIQKGQTYTYDLPNGVYQPFFYYGKGWNPKKDMDNGIIGGFCTNELYSKDEPQEIFNCVLSYVLQLSSNGNFQTESSNKSELF